MFDNIALLDDDVEMELGGDIELKAHSVEEFKLQELEQIKNDFPGVTVKENNFMMPSDQIDEEE
jgi:hypothetical protein